MDRRHFITAAAAGVVGLSLNAVAPASATPHPAGPALATPQPFLSAAPLHPGRTILRPAPKLPGEVSRVSNLVTTSAAHVPYDSIEVDIDGDLARIFLPQGVRPGSSTRVGAVWFFHGGGSDHNQAMAGGFKYPAQLVVDQGAIAICINAGGTLYSDVYAQECQANAWTYLSGLFRVRMNLLRATSAGGALATWTMGSALMPYQRGLYMVNGVYDIEKLYTDGDANQRASVGRAFAHDEERMAANNPAAIPASAWAGRNVKVVVSDDAHPDTRVPPRDHGLALADSISGIAAETQVAYHSLGHNTPSWTNKDMMLCFKRWSGQG